MRTLSLLGALTLVVGTQAIGQQFTPPTFDGIDKDKNGSLSKQEVAAWVATIPAGGPNGPPNADDVFGRWDANKDGSVSKPEFDSRPRPPGGGGPPGAGGAPPAGGAQPPAR
jgi:hypothetical protein